MNAQNEMTVTHVEEDPKGMAALAGIEYRISIHMQGTYREILEVGRCLIEAKESGLVPHGQWENWVRRNTGMGERQAQRLMQAARSVQAGSVMETLPISKIQVILSLPEPEREAMAEQTSRENLSLRELQAEVQRQRQRANEADERARRSELSRAEMEGRLRAELAEARATPDDGVSPKAQAEIDRLKEKLEEAEVSAGAEIGRLRSDLADAEAYAERQAEQRQQAQREMLALQSQAARGELGAADGLNSFDIAAAVRTFIGVAGVLPHMGATLAHIRVLQSSATDQSDRLRQLHRNDRVH